MSLQVFTFVNGRWRENCYILANPEGDALIIDPGGQPQKIKNLVDENHLHPQAILNTHAHYDHIGAVADLMEHYRLPFYLHSSDAHLLRHANLYRMVFGAHDAIRIPEISQDISSLPPTSEIASYQISWIYTPGHTAGSVCFLIDNLLFSGDTLMRNAVGRTDLPGGEPEQLLLSLAALQELPGETLVYGGHGPCTTIAAEFASGAPAWTLLQ
ncbi:MAG: MBL fold metallo-hydrolase [Candidatus Acidiferrum sp.]|jgi:glyoxylase-like metal-dependent hydrolase (beta-lactamase superfamily II)